MINTYIKIENDVISDFLKMNGGGRALLVYSYLLKIGGGSRAVQTDIAKLSEIIGIGLTTNGKASVAKTIDMLVDRGLIELCSNIRLDTSIKARDMVSKPKSTIWVNVKISTSKRDYTLIPRRYMDDIIFSESDDKAEDLFSILAYICMKTERREGTLLVMWSGRNNMARSLRMGEPTLSRRLDFLMSQEVIYFEKVELTGDRANYIYSLYDSRSDVSQAVSTAKENNMVDSRIKYASNSDSMIDIENGEFIIDMRLSSFFDRHDMECNGGIAEETNKFYRRHGQARLIDVLGYYNSEIISADNKAGAYRSVLRREY